MEPKNFQFFGSILHTMQQREADFYFTNGD